MAQKDVGNKVPIYKLKETKEVMDLYDEWGLNNKYDKDMVEWNYTGPKETVEVFNKHQKEKDINIYDAGCGTGLVGVELKKYGFTNFFGADLSQKLLDLVPNNLYKKLHKLDLNNRRIKLSVKAAQIDEEKSLIAKFGEGATKSGATLKGIFEKAIGKKDKKEK